MQHYPREYFGQNTEAETDDIYKCKGISPIGAGELLKVHVEISVVNVFEFLDFSKTTAFGPSSS